jgi:hypothetical protein
MGPLAGPGLRVHQCFSSCVFLISRHSVTGTVFGPTPSQAQAGDSYHGMTVTRTRRDATVLTVLRLTSIRVACLSTSDSVTMMSDGLPK